ncbi:hypothetical protein GCM10009665_32320 [Kitasatospora nipponensis]|uniref:Asp23/Gls24 family envelope stress response protein n=1 Tax=Kitasatospora nipponensis TaxID=258049 RepID=A0ABP4GYZ5_9ACTN
MRRPADDGGPPRSTGATAVSGDKPERDPGDRRGRGPGWGRDTGPGTPPDRRGRLRIADRAPSRIAWLAARDVLHEERVARAGAGPAAELEAPRVTARMVDGAAQVRIGVDLPFPCDLAGRGVAVLRAVATQLGQLAGVAACEVTVVVERPVPAGGERP